VIKRAKNSFYFASSTDIGPRYRVNQDSLAYCIEKNCFVLADGVGGHQGGEIASEFVVKTLLATQIELSQKSTAHSTKQSLKQQVLDTHLQLKTLGSDKKIEMGTTVVTGVIIDQQLHYTHVGDSRLYLLRNNLLALLTKDDTLKQQVLDSVASSDESIADAVPANIVTQALGISEEINVHYGCLDLKFGDVLLCSSDGLHDALTLQELQQLLITRSNLQQCADTLVNRALNRGAIDNISVLLVETPLPLFETLIHQVKSTFS
jgi:protein phosphatase